MSVCPTVNLAKIGFSGLRELLKQRAPRPESDPELARIVGSIIESVAKGGLEAALASAQQFDAPGLTLGSMVVEPEEMRRADVPAKHREAILKSIERVRHFHEKQLEAIIAGMVRQDLGWQWTTPARQAEPTGIEGQRLVPLTCVGVYVPGGKAEYPSSVIMNGLPARVAGVDQVTVCSPARTDGSLPPAVMVAASEVGIDRIIKVGGAAAVTLLAYGYDGFEGVDKVVGPGNKFVNEAKRQLWGRVGLDTYAGPSEVAVVVDETANPAWAAADWLSQIEHAEDNRGWLVASSADVATGVLEEIEKQLTVAPKEAIMRAALANHGIVIIVESREEAVEVVNMLAPEHMTLMVANPEQLVPGIRNSGCILVGDYTPQAAGDFVSGPSHTLPTAGASRFGSPVNVMDFLKFQSLSRFTREDLQALSPTIEVFGEIEGFPTHGRGGSIRFSK